MNQAYYICTEVTHDAKPFRRWTVYRDQAGFFTDPHQQTFQNITLTVVSILLKCYDEEWQQQNEKFISKIEEFVKGNYSSGIIFDDFRMQLEAAYTSREIHYHHTIAPLLKGTDTGYRLPSDTFAFRDIRDKGIPMRDIVQRIDYVVEAIKKIPGTDEQINFIYQTISDLAKANKAKINNNDPNSPGPMIIDNSYSHAREILNQLRDDILAQNTQKKPELDKSAEIEHDLRDKVEQYKKKMNEAQETIIQQEATIAQQKKEIEELKEQIDFFQQKKSAMTKRKDQRANVAVGLTRKQATVMADYLTGKLGLDFEDFKKGGKGLGKGYVAKYLWGYSEEKVRQTVPDKEDKEYVASIFGPFNPELAKEIYSAWNENVLPPWECEGE